jgi:hypothetical protein
LSTPQGHILLFQSKSGMEPTNGKWQMLLATASMMILLPSLSQRLCMFHRSSTKS